MATETKAFKNALIKLGIVAVCACLYSVGGYGFLPARRFIAPTVCVVGMFYFSRDWRCLPQLPLLMFSNALGYGADFLWVKVLKRGLFGLANGITGSIYNGLRRKWLLFGFQIIFLTASCIAFGVFNPFPSARVEELVIGLFMYAIPIFSVKEE